MSRIFQSAPHFSLFRDTIKKHFSSIHDGKNQPFPCSKCDFGFLTNSELQKHLASKHEGKKKEFCCDLCLADFSKSENLDFHIATVHEGKKPFKCHDCNSNFSRNAELTKHRIINPMLLEELI